MTRRAAHLVTAATVTVAVIGGAGPALAAGPPVIDRQVFPATTTDETAFPCSLSVTFSGALTTRTFPDDGTGVVEVDTANFAVLLTGPAGTLRLRNVGADVTRETPDGDVHVTVTGRAPFPDRLPYGFTGALRIDLGTGEVILEPQNTTTAEEVCAALGAEVS
jgi:hypothetical protein